MSSCSSSSSVASSNSHSQQQERRNDEQSSSKTSTADEHGGSSSNSNNNSSAEDKVRFVQQESRYVLYLRMVVLAILILAAAAVSILVFCITENGEREEFLTNYYAAADQITETFLDIARIKMGAAGSLVVAMIAEGLAKEKQWPFVTLSSFQERATTIMRLSGSLYIGMLPVVLQNEREEWEWYSTHSPDAKWYEEARAYQKLLNLDYLDNLRPLETDDPELNVTDGVASHIYDYNLTATAKAVISPEAKYYLPIWQTSPVSKRARVNQNRVANSVAADKSREKGVIAFDGMQFSTPGLGSDPDPFTGEFGWLLSIANREPTPYEGDIFTPVYFPIFHNFEANRTTAGVMRIVIHWARYFRNVFPDSMRGIIVVLHNSCQEPYTYQINGGTVLLLGHGDLHDPAYNRYVRKASFRTVGRIEDGTAMGMDLHQDACPYEIDVYPSNDFLAEYQSSTPFVVTFSVACVFLFTVIMFFVYDRLVERRQTILMRKAKQTHEIVASLFPKNVRDQLLQEDDNRKNGYVAPNHRLKSFLADGQDYNSNNQAPIADLYPHATVMFADISGFTSWSSSREPAQVFILLQRVYQAFDGIAKQRKVFKVETIGDSYVAVTGLPEPQAKHAVIMARFAQECLLKMMEVTRDLEKTLGPDTGDLTMRFGLHSGPVTAGVLRGERSRFQLFGDTVNTAARIESTGIPGKIQCSQSTADLLLKAGKEHWVKPREDNVIAKGKGVLKTFWLSPLASRAASMRSTETGTSTEGVNNPSRLVETRADYLLKHERLIDWMTEIFQEGIRQVVAQRQVRTNGGVGSPKASSTPTAAAVGGATSTVTMPRKAGRIALDEVVEAIHLPEFDAIAAGAEADAVQIPGNVVDDIRSYVSIVASTYRDNPFHNFEHACHVTMSVSKFLKRIVTPEIELEEISKLQDKDKLAQQIASHLHDYTHGLTSDPITMFAIVFSALIHDVDHRGVSNVQLGKEEPAMTALFRGKSIAEQNSLDIAWELLMSDRFEALRAYVFTSSDDLARFRQVVVNVVLATDIFDKELNDLRKARWEKAFSEGSSVKSNHSLRATIVMEHIMQASDVCHTMQHWHIYRKWNQRLFFELMKAFKAGRMASDPSTFWYKGELGFFDNYIIPLAGKLKDCNVFGVSSDECLNYALRNRAEWEERGEGIVAEMIAECL